MADDNFQLVTVAQLIAANNWLSHDTEDFIDAARIITSQVIGPAVAERDQVNEVLRKRGFDHPQGARGVDDALSLQTARWEAAQARIDAALAACAHWALADHASHGLIDDVRHALLAPWDATLPDNEEGQTDGR